MKKWFSAGLLLTGCLTLFSCKKTSGYAFFSDTDETLLSEFSKRKIEWTDELEKTRLTEESSKSINLKNGIKLNSLSYAVFVANKDESLYPFLEGFGSLDLSSVNSEAKQLVENFCSSLCSEQNLDEFVDKKNMSSLVFFQADVNELAGEKKLVEEDSAESKVYRRFTDYIYGKPFESEDTYAVPVCFWSEKYRLTVFLYLNKKSDWKINQIQIKKWQVS